MSNTMIVFVFFLNATMLNISIILVPCYQLCSDFFLKDSPISLLTYSCIKEMLLFIAGKQKHLWTLFWQKLNTPAVLKAPKERKPSKKEGGTPGKSSSLPAILYR